MLLRFPLWMMMWAHWCRLFLGCQWPGRPSKVNAESRSSCRLKLSQLWYQIDVSTRLFDVCREIQLSNWGLIEKEWRGELCLLSFQVSSHVQKDQGRIYHICLWLGTRKGKRHTRILFGFLPYVLFKLKFKLFFAFDFNHLVLVPSLMKLKSLNL